MAPNRIMRGGAALRALLAGAALIAILLALGGCGGGDGGTTGAVPDKTADAAVLNEVLSRQSAAVEAYDRTLRSLGGRPLAFARLFRAQEQEHVDATVKSLRGLGADAEPSPEEIEAGKLETEAEYLLFLYELESATIDAEFSAISKLTEPGPRAIVAATAANQAEHLVVLRQLLGAKPLETVPTPFENGTTPAPSVAPTQKG